MPDKIKIIFLIPNLMAGGAERVISFLVKNLNSECFDCKLIVIGSKAKIAYDIGDISISFLEKDRVLHSLPALIKILKRENPHIVLSTITHLNVALGAISFLFKHILFVGRQAAITKAGSDAKGIEKKSISATLSKLALRNLDYIICQSRDMAKDCMEVYQIHQNRIKVVQNPITDEFSVKNRTTFEKQNLINFITVGRLVNIKGHNRIINALSQLKQPFHYTIIGDGPLKPMILMKADELGISSNITYIGYTNQIYKYLAENDYYLQGSFSEGFPNALLESCAVGTPAIAFDVPGGTKEIIENGINGYLVNTEEEFLERLHDLPALDPKMVSESVYKKFDKTIILEQYEQFFLEIVDNN